MCMHVHVLVVHVNIALLILYTGIIYLVIFLVFLASASATTHQSVVVNVPPEKAQAVGKNALVVQ